MWLGGSAGALVVTAIGLMLSVNAPAAPPSLTLEATDAVIGGTIHATAQLTESPGATGEITFEVFGADDPTCAGPALDQSSTTVAGEGPYTSDDIEPSNPGPYHWSARYPGDGVNEPAEAACSATSTISKASPELTGNATSGTLGGAIHDEVTLSGGFSPGGEVTFSVYGPNDATCATPLETSTATLSGNEAASDDFNPQQAGAFRWSADYEGDANNEPFTLGCEAAGQTSTVAKVSPDLSGAATSTVVVGNTITDQATLSGGFSPGGQIVFRAFGPGDATCATTPAYEATVAVNGNGSYSPPGFSPGPGVYRWTAKYKGDGNNETAGLACNADDQSSTVTKASPQMAGISTSGSVGSTIHNEVTLTGAFSPSGEVTFSVYGPGDTACATPLETTSAPIQSGKAVSGEFTTQQAGVFRWTASYGGNANNEPFELDCDAPGQASSVAKASPGLSATATSSVVVGNTITDQATLSGGFSPGGQIVFRAFGPGDATCATSPAYESTVPVSGNGSYSPAGFSPGPGVYRWTAEYEGDGNNETAGLVCGAANQTSNVAKASPGLSGTATSTTVVGNTITDQATLSGGFSPGGQILFRAFGPGDASCGSTAAYEATVPVSGNGPYSPSGFSPGPGLYRWTAEYKGDGNNQAAGLGCNASGQSSAVGTIDPTLSASASGGTVGIQVAASATLSNGATPGGEITFKVFQSGDASCSGAVMFSSTIKVSGNGTYRSDAFLPARVGAYRWTVAYSGDANHAPASVGCGQATSTIVQAKPSIAGGAPQRIVVGTAFQDVAALQGGYAPNGTVTFRIYGPVAGGCSGPAFINTIAVKSNGTVSSDPFVPLQTGRYSFAVSYSGDSDNQAASEPCDSPSQVVQVVKRSPQVKPRAALVGGRKISIRAHLSGGFSPTGSIAFKLYGPNDSRCHRKPKFGGKVTVKSNGTFPLARYLATKPGVYRLSVAYSGDKRNLGYKGTCGTAQSIRIK